MRVFIPTRGREGRQITAKALTKAGIHFTLVLSQPEEHPYPSIQVSANNLAEKRQCIMNEAGFEKVVMLDDDLRFRARTEENRFLKATPSKLFSMFKIIDGMLDHYAQVGVADEFMAQHRPRGWTVGGRYNQLLAFNPMIFPECMPQFRQVSVEEQDFNLQLLTQGYPACVINEWTKTEVPYAKGGCSSYRDGDNEERCFREFADRWPGLVQLRESNTTASGLRVQISWKKALAAGKEVRDIDV